MRKTFDPFIKTHYLTILEYNSYIVFCRNVKLFHEKKCCSKDRFDRIIMIVIS